MSYAAKECIRIGRKGAYNTTDFTKVFGADLTINNKVVPADESNRPVNKDQLIIIMANTIMELTSKGKFNLGRF